MRGLLVSSAKCLGFLGIWTLVLAIVVMTAVGLGGESWFADIGWRFWVEVGGAVAALAALAFMALVVDKRGLATLGFPADARVAGLLVGAGMGAAIFAVPLGLLLALGAARIDPDLGGFSAAALALSLLLCLFNVVHQEVLVRSYIFQEIWKKSGALAATLVTTALFVALHAAPISQGGTQGLVAGANILLASLMLCLAYVRTGALWLPIGIHLGWNALQGPVLGIAVTGADIGLGDWRVFAFSGDPLFTGGEMGLEGGLAGLLGPVLGLALVAFVARGAPSR